MLQVIPAVNQIHGWGNANEQQIAIKEDRCGRVVSFTVTCTSIDSAGYQLTLTRISNTDNLWSMTAGGYGELYLIDTNN